LNTAALNVENLCVWFETQSGRVPVVDNISFSINAGEITGLVGESGCGKTMTANAILGLLPASGMGSSADCVEVNGKDIFELGTTQKRTVLGRDIAMIFQQPATALDPVFTVGQQIAAVYRRHNGGSKQQVRQTMLDTLESVGFSKAENIAASYPHQLSGGMRQLVMIAMATICKPAVIIADEPTTALDISTRALILQELKNLQKQHQTAILFVSHDLSVIRQICRNILVMYCGRIMETSDSQSFFSHARHPYSAGLLSCIPRIAATHPGPINAIPGQIPTASDLPSGCHFAPRCVRAEEKCSLEAPTLDYENGRATACYRPL
jgi:peptide/nickel transport system ATP-binding protein